MKVFKNIAFAIFALSLCTQNSIAQNNSKFQKSQKQPIITTIPVAQNTQSAFSQIEIKQIFGENSPRPGIYKIRSLLSGLCVAPDIKHGLGDVLSGYNSVYVLQTMDCVINKKYNSAFKHYVAIIPNPLGGYTIRRAVDYSPKDTDGSFPLCATVARNVVFGPSTIDFINCQAPSNATQINQMGSDDQRYTFEAVSPNVYIVHTNNGECWDVRDAAQVEEAEIIRWGCNGRPNQKFEFTYLKPLPDGEVKNGIISQGYKNGVDGLWRVISTPNISFTGTPYSSAETIKDNGLACSNLCLNEKKCVNWVYNASDPAINPICSLRDNFSSPIRTQGTIGGSIRH